MNVGLLISRLAERGVTLRADGGRLRFRARGRLDEKTRALIRRNREAILSSLSKSAAQPTAPKEVLAELLDVLREVWEERAAIYEFEGKLSRVEAECRALSHVRAALDALYQPR